MLCRHTRCHVACHEQLRALPQSLSDCRPIQHHCCPHGSVKLAVHQCNATSPMRSWPKRQDSPMGVQYAAVPSLSAKWLQWSTAPERWSTSRQQLLRVIWRKKAAFRILPRMWGPASDGRPEVGAGARCSRRGAAPLPPPLPPPPPPPPLTTRQALTVQRERTRLSGRIKTTGDDWSFRSNTVSILGLTCKYVWDHPQGPHPSSP